jgi:hypothetical protein
VEFGIPQSGSGGGKGWADLLNLTDSTVFEIKRADEDLTEASEQLMRYRYYGALNCPGLEDLKYGVKYPSPRIITGATPGSLLAVELVSPGILVFSKFTKPPVPVPIPVPVSKKQTEEEKQKQKQQLEEVLIGAGIAAAVIAVVLLAFVAAPFVAAAFAEIIEVLVAAGIEEQAAWQLLRNAGLLGAT